MAAAAHDLAQLPEDMEVDPETGRTETVRYTTCNDVGNIINPAIVLGQIHGGTAQGLGQALLEECVYDDYGQLISGSFMDYAMPRAADIPEFDCHFNNVPCTTNPMGTKDAGEAGATLINAIIDTLWDDGVRDIKMPATPLRVWQAIQDAASVREA